MARTLSTEVHEEIFKTMQSAFSDFPLFQSLVAAKLKTAIADSNNIEINVKTTRKVVERYYAIDVFKTPEQKVALGTIRIIFQCCYVLISSKYESSQALFWKDIDTLLKNYPQFRDQDAEEQRYLLNFRNYMKVALLIVPARLNKQLLLRIAARLEGSQNEYVTGGGQKPCVTRRVEIYEKEGNVVAERRVDRPMSNSHSDTDFNERLTKASILSASAATSSSGAKRKKDSSSAPAKQAKLMRLQSDELRAITSSDPTQCIPPMYLTSAQLEQQQAQLASTSSSQGNRPQELDSLQGLLDLSRTSSVGGGAKTYVFGEDIQPLPLPTGIFRGETDMLISSCGLLSSCSDLWNESLAQIENGHVQSEDLYAVAPAVGFTASSSAAAAAVPYIPQHSSEPQLEVADLWRGALSSNGGADHPDYLNTSIDLYNGSLTEDLRSMM